MNLALSPGLRKLAFGILPLEAWCIHTSITVLSGVFLTCVHVYGLWHLRASAWWPTVPAVMVGGRAAGFHDLVPSLVCVREKTSLPKTRHLFFKVSCFFKNLI